MDSVPPGESKTGETRAGELRAPAPHAGHGRTEEPRRPSRGRQVFWFIVVLVVAGGLLGAAGAYEYIAKPAIMAKVFAAMAPKPTPVETAKATTEAMPRAFESIGTLTAAHQVTVAPEVEGRVETIRFDSGQDVKQGDVLVELDAATQRADLASYQAQAKLASLNLARSRELASKQFSSKQSVDQLQSELDQAKAGIAKSQALIDRMTIRAPFGGTLGIRQVNLGQYLASGTAIVTLTDLTTLYVDFSLPEQNRAQLSLGQPVDIRVDAFPDRVFQGALDAIDPQVDPNMRAVKLRATLANTDLALQPGMYARISVVLPPQPNVVTVPEAAIDYTVYGESVFVVREGKDKDAEGKPTYTVEQTFVTLGSRNGGKVGVLKGVAAGDMVVVGGQLKLHNGAAVELSSDKSLVTPAATPVE
jgi:multidrug efflux system membrane fusion protein